MLEPKETISMGVDMRVIIFLVIALMVLPLVSYAQVDTLVLVEIGSIQASSEITELYIEDLDGDSLKEIILCTNYFVYIYDSQTYQLEWTSPQLSRPTDLLFKDINNDGLINLSVKDYTNIHLFDPHTPGTIWTSPPLDSTYKCYTIGDRNDDDWVDVAIVSKEWFTRSQNWSNHDTVLAVLYDGPSFQDQSDFFVLMRNIYITESGYLAHVIEFPVKVKINDLAGQDSAIVKIFILTYKEEHWILPDLVQTHEISGGIWLIDVSTFDIDQIFESGDISYIEFSEQDGSTYLHTVSRTLYMDSPNIDDDKRLINTYSADTLISSTVIWQDDNSDSDWKGFVVDDISYNHNGPEIAYSSDDSISLYQFPDAEHMWVQELNDIDSVLYRYVDSSLYNSPQIICAIGDPLIEYNFFSGADGTLSAILPNPGFYLSQVADLDGDGNDEILSIQGSSLYVYDLDVVTGVGDDARFPRRAFLRPNYPNPFNSSTTIEYGLPEAEHVNIEIYDLLGRKVETLVNEDKQAGRHQVIWEANLYASGLYFYRIEAGDYSDTKRMVLLK